MASKISFLCYHHFRERNEGYHDNSGSSRCLESVLCMKKSYITITLEEETKLPLERLSHKGSLRW